MIEDMKLQNTIKKDTVYKLLKHNRSYFRGIEAERLELIQQLADCQKQLSDLELFADIENDIGLSAHIGQIATANGQVGDPVGKVVCFRDKRYKQVERAIKHIYAELERNNMRAEAAFWIKYIYNLTQEVLPLHYSVMNQLWFTCSGTYRQIALEEKISNANIRKCLENEVEAVYVILCEVIGIYEKTQITPELVNEILTGHTELYQQLSNIEKGKQRKGE